MTKNSPDPIMSQHAIYIFTKKGQNDRNFHLVFFQTKTNICKLRRFYDHISKKNFLVKNGHFGPFFTPWKDKKCRDDIFIRKSKYVSIRF